MAVPISDGIVRKLTALEKELEEGDITEKGFEKKRALLLGPHGGENALARYLATHPAAAAQLKYQPRTQSVSALDAPAASAETHPRTASDSVACPSPARRAQEPPSLDTSASASDFAQRKEALRAGLAVGIGGPRPGTSLPSSPAPQRAAAAPSIQNATASPKPQPANFGGPPPPPPVVGMPPMPPPVVGAPPPVASAPTSNGDASGGMSGGTDSALPTVNEPLAAEQEFKPNKLLSSRIQQLMASLQTNPTTPKKQFSKGSGDAPKTLDPNAPKPTGGVMVPLTIAPQALPPDEYRFGDDAHVTSLGDVARLRGHGPLAKKIALTVLDGRGKEAAEVSFGKIAKSAEQLAFALTHKFGVNQGDRVAIVLPPWQADVFVWAFYGCMMAGAVAIPVASPAAVDDPNIAHSAFLLSGCGVRVALTTDAARKDHPRDDNGKPVALKGWPKMEWHSIDSLPRVHEQAHASGAGGKLSQMPAYVEGSVTETGEVKAIHVSHAAAISVARSLAASLQCTASNTMVMALDCASSPGLWFGALMAVYVGLHVIVIPYSTFEQHPAVWMASVSKHKAQIAVSIIQGLALCSASVPERDRKALKLQSLRAVVAVCDRFPADVARAFCTGFGIPDPALSPCFASPESLPVSIRPPSLNPVKVCIDTKAAGFGLVQVVPNGTPGALILFDCGSAIPKGKISIISPGKQPLLCRSDEIGEICMHGPSVGSGYWGLEGKSAMTFQVKPGNARDESELYVRTGWLGFTHDGRLFVTGGVGHRVTAEGRYISLDDIQKAVLAVKPSAVHRDRVAVFSVSVYEEERIVIAFETAVDPGDGLSKYIEGMIGLVEEAQSIAVYGCVAVPPDTLPLTREKQVHSFNCKKAFLSGSLSPIHVVMRPTTVQNLPKAAPKTNEALKMMGDAITGAQIADSAGADVERVNDDASGRCLDEFRSIPEILRWRATTTPDAPAVTSVDSTGRETLVLSFGRLHAEATRVALFLSEKLGLHAGDNVALVFPTCTEFVVALYACMYIGAVPVPVRAPPPGIYARLWAATSKRIVDMADARAVLTTEAVTRALRQKEMAGVMEGWPALHAIEDAPKKKAEMNYYRPPTAELLSHIEFTISANGVLAGIKIAHETMTAFCRAQKVAAKYPTNRAVVVCADTVNGAGLAFAAFVGIYCGFPTVLVGFSDLEQSPPVWFSTIGRYKAISTIASVPVIELCMRALSKNTPQALAGSLASLKYLSVDSPERPRADLLALFAAAFASIGLQPGVIDSPFTCAANAIVAMRTGDTGDASRSGTLDAVYLQLKALHQDRIEVVERGSPNSICVPSSGKLLPRVKVAIVHPDTGRPCMGRDIGEIWVCSPHNGKGYYGLLKIINDELSKAHFRCSITGGNQSLLYARTGYLGFLSRAGGGPGATESLYVVGAIEESFFVDGYRHFAVDVEHSIERSHKKILDGRCVVFMSQKLLVAVIEVADAADLLSLVPIVTSTVLDEHALVLHVLAFVQPGTVPCNARGQKQRIRLRDGFVAGGLDPIHVAYNI